MAIRRLAAQPDMDEKRAPWGRRTYIIRYVKKPEQAQRGAGAVREPHLQVTPIFTPV